ncbi:MAG TPA: OsmC family protein [Ramlibacter sp.]
MNDVVHIRDRLQQVTESLGRRAPEAKPDQPARAVWKGGLLAELVTDKPQALLTDMPLAVGGQDRAPSPGWYFRAGAAACLVSTIAMHAAVRGLALRRLEVEAHSESDARGMLGCGEGVPPGPQRMWLDVLIEADGADRQALEDLVAYADAHAPMSGALRRPLDVRARIRPS